MSDAPAIVQRPPMSTGKKLAIGGLIFVAVGSLIATVIVMILAANKPPDTVPASGSAAPSSGSGAKSGSGPLTTPGPSTGSSSGTGSGTKSGRGPLTTLGTGAGTTVPVTTQLPPENQTMYIRVSKDLADGSQHPDVLNKYNEWGFAVSELKIYVDGRIIPRSAYSNVSYTRGKQYDATFPASNMIDGDRTTCANATPIFTVDKTRLFGEAMIHDFNKNAPMPLVASIPMDQRRTEITATLFVPAKITSIEVYNVINGTGGRPTPVPGYSPFLEDASGRPHMLAGARVFLEDAYGNTLWKSDRLTGDDIQVLTPKYGALGFQGFVTSVSTIGQRISAIARRLMS